MSIESLLLWERTCSRKGLCYRQQDDGLEKIAHTLRVFNGSRSELAKELGLSERTLYRRLRALGIAK